HPVSIDKQRRGLLLDTPTACLHHRLRRVIAPTVSSPTDGTVQKRSAGMAHTPDLCGKKMTSVQRLPHRIYDMLALSSIGSQLAARNRDQAILGHIERMLSTHRRGRFPARFARAYKGTKPRPRAVHILIMDWPIGKIRLRCL